MNVWLVILLTISLAMPVSALDIQAPPVPDSGEEWMPDSQNSLAEGLLSLLEKGIRQIVPNLTDGWQCACSVLVCVMINSLLQQVSAGRPAELVTGTVIAGLLLQNADAMIRLGMDTIRELSEYGKLLFPVMTAAMAAQGGTVSSGALYAGTTVFNTVLCSLISNGLVPMVYLFLALAVGNSVCGEDLLKNLRDLVKSLVSWCLKTVLTVFTTYMSITGVVSGTTDAAALKAARVTISSVVPVVGGVLSEASEAVLVSAGLMKNAAGIYGILAVLAVFLQPFLKIWCQYITLKFTAAICGLFGSKRVTGLIEDFSAALGLLLAMTGASCLLVLISTVCFMKGVG